MSENLLKITITGDILCQKQLIEKAKSSQNKYDFSQSFLHVKPLLLDSDIVIGNLETPILYDADKYQIRKTSFGAPKEFAEAVYDAGIHYVSTANNHALDRGIDGLNSTIEILDDIGFKHTGTFNTPQHPNLIFQKKGIKFGMLAYTYGTNAHRNKNYLKESEEWIINLFQKQELSNKYLRYIFLNKMKNPILRLLDITYCLFHPYSLFRHVGERRQNDSYEIKQLKKDIHSLKENNCDFYIMCMHIGGQFNSNVSIYTKKTANFLKKSGINLIIGNHEHVIHNCDLTSINNNQFATYCLGNFLSAIGVVEEPFDKGAEYSILCHIFIKPENKKIARITYNVLTTIQNTDGKLETFPAFELYTSESNPTKKSEIQLAIANAVKNFTGKNNEPPRSEYILYEA